LITVDLCGISRDISDYVAGELERDDHIPRRSVLINASHTHSGPVIEGYLSGLRLYPDADWADIVAYRRELEKRMVRAAEESLRHLQPATLAWGMDAAGFAVNRRNNKEADVPALRRAGKLRGPVDHDVPVLSIRSADGRLVAALASYSCHNTTLKGYLYSGDYAGYAQLEIERRHPGAVALFVQGCAGNINALPRGQAQSEDYGRQLADAVDRALAKPMQPVGPGFSSALIDISLSFAHRPTEGELKKASESALVYDQAWARFLTAQSREPGGIRMTYSYPLQAWRLGDLTWLALGGEPMVDYELRLQKECGRRLWVFGYSNDVMCYIPSESVLAEGGYEGNVSMILYARPSPWAPGLEDKIDAAAQRVIRTVGGP
jgi:hypothetical protein